MTYNQTAEFIAYELMGSCKSLYEVLEDHDMGHAENDISFCSEIDSLAFQCTCCGWWYEISEMSIETDEWICLDCESE